MSEFDPVSDPRDCGADAAGYALGALAADEAEAFRRHVSGCIVCRDEVAALQAMVGALSMAAPQLRAPNSLKRQTLSRLRVESKATKRHISPTVLIPALSMARRGALATGGLLAAAAVCVGALGIAAGSTRVTKIVPAAVIDQGEFADAVLHVGAGNTQLIVSHMPAPPNGEIYQVWLKRPGKAPEPTSTLFSVTSSGTGTADVQGSLHGVSEVMVTPEPLGGSVVPTHAPVIVAPLAS